MSVVQLVNRRGRRGGAGGARRRRGHWDWAESAGAGAGSPPKSRVLRASITHLSGALPKESMCRGKIPICLTQKMEYLKKDSFDVDVPRCRSL